LITANFSCT